MVREGSVRIRRYIPLIGRILLAALFLKSGLDKILNPDNTEQMMSANKVLLPSVLIILVVLIEVGGGLALLFGFKARWAALLLFFYLAMVTLVFHNKLGDEKVVRTFMSNVGLMGGLLMLVYFGPGPVSVDEYLASREVEPDTLEGTRISRNRKVLE